MNIVPSSQNEFCERFEAQIGPSERVIYKFQFPNYPYSVDHYDTIEYNTAPAPIEAVAIHMPKDRLEDLFALLGSQQYRELKIREQAPAVKKAYENYRLLLKMCGGDADGY
jgi:hypothetical protein